jgi:hypothetical protein
MAEDRDTLPVRCVWCGKLFTGSSDLSCGAKVPSHLAHGSDGSWCRTDDIAKMLAVRAAAEIGRSMSNG